MSTGCGCQRSRGRCKVLIIEAHDAILHGPISGGRLHAHSMVRVCCPPAMHSSWVSDVHFADINVDATSRSGGVQREARCVVCARPGHPTCAGIHARKGEHAASARKTEAYQTPRHLRPCQLAKENSQPRPAWWRSDPPLATRPVPVEARPSSSRPASSHLPSDLVSADLC